LIGFWRFPVGWSWTEIRPPQEAEILPYEPRAKDMAKLGLHPPRLSSEEMSKTAFGEAAKLRGQRHRREQISRALYGLIERQQVLVFPERLVFPETIGNANELSRGLDPQERLKIWIAESQIGARLWTRRRCKIDVSQIIERILSDVETRGRRPQYDWLKIERWCRNYIELVGLPETHHALAEKALIPISNPPDSKQVEQLVSKLFNEYQ
jgi:hypothetical protein